MFLCCFKQGAINETEVVLKLKAGWSVPGKLGWAASWADRFAEEDLV